MDKSNGYEDVASLFLKGRGIAFNGIGKSTVRNWAQTLVRGSVILDLGCGTGIPVSKTLVDAGMIVYGIDAQIKLINKASAALKTGGKFLFTATYSRHTWKDIMTNHLSLSLGAERYRELIAASGLSLAGEFKDEGENYYFDSV